MFSLSLKAGRPLIQKSRHVLLHPLAVVLRYVSPSKPDVLRLYVYYGMLALFLGKRLNEKFFSFFYKLSLARNVIVLYKGFGVDSNLPLLGSMASFPFVLRAAYYSMTGCSSGLAH